MKLGWGVVALCVATCPALADPVTYTFDVVGGQITMAEQTLGYTVSGVAGTFALTIYQSNGHVGESDTFILEDAALTNTDLLYMSIGGIARSSVNPGSMQLLDFAPDGPGHIGPGGLSAVDTDAFVSATAIITGAFNTTWSTAAWAGELVPFDLTFATSVTASDALTVGLAGTYSWVLGVAELNMTLTIDLIIEAVGTAHVVPDPAFGGLTAMGLAGAGIWLRRRRA